jgi:hypothetical protein
MAIRLDDVREIIMQDIWEEFRFKVVGLLVGIAYCQSNCNDCRTEAYSETIELLNDAMRAEEAESIWVESKAPADIKTCDQCQYACSQDLRRIRQIRDVSELLLEIKDTVDKMHQKSKDCLEQAGKEAQEIGQRWIPTGVEDGIYEVQNRVHDISEKIRESGGVREIPDKINSLKQFLTKAVDQMPGEEYANTRFTLIEIKDSCLQVADQTDKAIEKSEEYEQYESSLEPPPSRKVGRIWLLIPCILCLSVSVVSFLIGRYVKTWPKAAGSWTANAMGHAAIQLIFNRLAGPVWKTMKRETDKSG